MSTRPVKSCCFLAAPAECWYSRPNTEQPEPGHQIYFFRQIATFLKVCAVFVFWASLQTLESIDFSKIYQLYGLKPKNKGRTNFYECCDLTKKVYLLAIYFHPILNLDLNSRQSHAWNSNVVCICMPNTVHQVYE